MENIGPDYKEIYTDILTRKFPHKKSSCEFILQKKILSTLDIIKLNELIFSSGSTTENQQFRSYSRNDVAYILEYQKKHNLNNTQLALHFKMSRNTIFKWKKAFGGG